MFSLLKILLSAFWLLLTVGVLISLWRNPQTSSSNKLLWTVGVLIFPILGPVMFILFGDRTVK